MQNGSQKSNQGNCKARQHLLCCNVPSCVERNTVCREQPMRAQGWQIVRQNHVSHWWFSAQQASRHAGRDVMTTTRQHFTEKPPNITVSEVQVQIGDNKVGWEAPMRTHDDQFPCHEAFSCRLTSFLPGSLL